MKFAIPILWLVAMAATRFGDPLVVITAVAVSGAVIVGWREWSTLRPLLRVTTKIAGWSVLATAAMVGVTYLFFPLLVREFPEIGAQTHSIYARFLSHRTLPVLIAAILPVVVAEEVLWRGVFQQSMIRAGVIASAGVYAVVHAPSGSLLLVSVAFVCGLYWSGLRAISGSLIPSLCAHLVWDLALIVFPLVVS